MSHYAKNTSVSVERSEAEIKRVLLKYGVSEIMSGMSREKNLAFVMFKWDNLPIKIRIPLPDFNDPKFQETPGGRKNRTKEAANKEWEKAARQQWRVLLLMIKSQCETIVNGIFPAAEVFMPWLMLPNNMTAFEFAAEDLRRMCETGKMPKLLPLGKG